MARNDLAGLAKRMHAAPTLLQREMRQAVAVGGQQLGQAARRRQPASGRLRNVGKSGGPIGVQVSVKGNVRPAALVRGTGVLHLLDNPTKPGPRPRRRAVGRRTAGSTGGHPGTPGKSTFRKGVAEALPAAKATVEAAFRRAPRLF